MNKKKILLSISALAVIGVMSFTAINYAAAQNKPVAKPGQNYTVEQRDALNQAIENNDYNAWKDLTQGKGKVSQIINETNFAKFAEAHKLITTAKTIKQELGLKTGHGQHLGCGCKTK